VRRAAIDIGTNSVRLLVADVVGNRVAPVSRSMEITRLGEKTDASGVLSETAIARTAAAVRSFRARARAAGASRISAIGTSAVRDASNRSALFEAVAPLAVRVLTGDEEAEMGYRGVRAGARAHAGPLLVVDIGGGSTELVLGDGDDVLSRASLRAGAVRMTERFLHGDPPPDVDAESLAREVSLLLTAARHRFHGAPAAIGVGGTMTTLAAIDQSLEPYDPERVHGYRLTRAKIASIARGLCAMPLALRRRLPGLQPARADIICAGALIARTILEDLDVREIEVSESDLLWGAVLE
jgi:exopolyphosphatase/guanosine-5'-triphosphate,3'-diphosphate pyrophosphatase